MIPVENLLELAGNCSIFSVLELIVLFCSQSPILSLYMSILYLYVFVMIYPDLPVLFDSNFALACLASGSFNRIDQHEKQLRVYQKLSTTATSDWTIGRPKTHPKRGRWLQGQHLFT